MIQIIGKIFEAHKKTLLDREFSKFLFKKNGLQQTIIIPIEKAEKLYVHINENTNVESFRMVNFLKNGINHLNKLKKEGKTHITLAANTLYQLSTYITSLDLDVKPDWLPETFKEQNKDFPLVLHSHIYYIVFGTANPEYIQQSLSGTFKVAILQFEKEEPCSMEFFDNNKVLYEKVKQNEELSKQNDEELLKVKKEFEEKSKGNQLTTTTDKPESISINLTFCLSEFKREALNRSTQHNLLLAKVFTSALGEASNANLKYEISMPEMDELLSPIFSKYIENKDVEEQEIIFFIKDKSKPFAKDNVSISSFSKNELDMQSLSNQLGENKFKKLMDAISIIKDCGVSQETLSLLL